MNSRPCALTWPAALINLIAIALYHDKQSDWLNGTAAALCIIIALLHFWHRRERR